MSEKCTCEVVVWNHDDEAEYEIKYCPLHAYAEELLEFIKDIRPFLGHDPEATIHKRADELIAKSTPRGSATEE